MAILTDQKAKQQRLHKIKSTVFNYIANATADELQAMQLKIKEKEYRDLIKKRARFSQLEPNLIIALDDAIKSKFSG